MTAAIPHPLLEACGVEHGFGVRGAPEPRGLVRPVQVHGAAIATPEECRRGRCEADGIVSRQPGAPVGVVTADCVPVLIASQSGCVVAAVHAGWRGLAKGVIAAGVAAARREAGEADPLVAAIGPHIGPCCYEVDTPVLEALEAPFGASLHDALRPTRPEHAALDLGALARVALVAAGVAPERSGGLPGICTRCDAARFHSFRRDGTRAGRLLHFVAARALDTAGGQT